MHGTGRVKLLHFRDVNKNYPGLNSSLLKMCKIKRSIIEINHAGLKS